MTNSSGYGFEAHFGNLGQRAAGFTGLIKIVVDPDQQGE
jgi:hypothetical protein